MKFGDLTNVLEEDETIFESIQNNFNSYNSKPKSKIAKILTKLSNFGMSYDDDIISKMQALPADKILQPKDQLITQSIYGINSSALNWRIKQDEEKPFNAKSLSQKRNILRALAQQPELEDILDVMANEAIVYDDHLTYICNPFLDTSIIETLNEESAKEIKNAISSCFYKLYALLNWRRTAWDTFKRWLIEGVLAYEIVYDDIKNPKLVLQVVPVDPVTLTKKYKNGTYYWVQFDGVLGSERELLDSQIVYIKYEDSGVSERQSYLERLIRPFNLYRIVEQAQIIWTVTQSSFKTMFTIPVGDVTKTKGIQTLSSAMNRYKEDISFNGDTGELKINGKTNMPFNKEYWMPENSIGSPSIETIVDNGPSLNDSEQIRYFESKLYRMSKIPASRFDKDAGTTWFGSDPTAATREEIDFSRFVNRLRNTFGEILLKPLRIQVALMLPGLKNDKRILDAISLQFNSYNLFEEQMNIEIETKRVEHIASLKDAVTITDDEGNETSFFSMKFLIEKYLKLSEADFELNERYKKEEKLAKQEGEDEEGNKEDGNEDMGDLDNNDENDSGKENEGGSDIDSEMMGSVQPESSETSEI